MHEAAVMRVLVVYARQHDFAGWMRGKAGRNAASAGALLAVQVNAELMQDSRGSGASPDGCVDEQQGDDEAEISIVEQNDGKDSCDLHGP